MFVPAPFGAELPPTQTGAEYATTCAPQVVLDPLRSHGGPHEYEGHEGACLISLAQLRSVV